MNFEDLQKTWQAHDACSKVTIDANALLKEVRRKQQQFWAAIFWRDVREVGVIGLVGLFFGCLALRGRGWPNYLLAIACLGVCVFFVMDRLVQRKKRPAAKDPLKACVESSLDQVEHQIWLLKNILWWYLSPVVLALGISVVVSMWHSRHAATALAGWGLYSLLGFLLYWGVYRLNQLVVRKNLVPRREELQALLAGLE